MSKVRRWWVSSFPTSTPSLPISPTALASLACVSREFWWRQLFLKIFSQRMPKGVFYPQPSQPAGALIWSTDAVNAKWTWPNCIRHEMHWNTITGIDMIHTVHEPNCNDLSSSCQVHVRKTAFSWDGRTVAHSCTNMHQPCSRTAASIPGVLEGEKHLGRGSWSLESLAAFLGQDSKIPHSR